MKSGILSSMLFLLFFVKGFSLISVIPFHCEYSCNLSIKRFKEPAVVQIPDMTEKPVNEKACVRTHYRMKMDFNELKTENHIGI